MIRVVTPPAVTRLATPEGLAGELGVPVSDRLGLLIDQASAAIVRYCGQPFALARYEETLAGNGCDQTVILGRLPVAALVSVLVNQAATVFTADLLNGGFHLASPLWGVCQVVYDAGYVLPGQQGHNLPADIERACLDRAAAIYGATGRDRTVRSETNEGIGSVSYADMGKMFGNDLSVLDGYRVLAL